MHGYTPGRFSFNVKGGRCEACEGDGVKRVESGPRDPTGTPEEVAATAESYTGQFLAPLLRARTFAR